MSRLAAIKPAEATPEQRELFDAITSGPRGRGRPPESFLDASGGLTGPFNPWMCRPDLGGIAHRIGERLRYHGVLSGAAREIAILVVGARWEAEYEWWAHARIGRNEGLSDATIDALHRRERPAFDDPMHCAVHDFARALVDTGHVEQSVYDAAHAHLGDSGVVEIVTLVGYYCLVSFTLNAFEIPLPAGETPVFGGSR